jgi:thioredoxin reductase (NADPH)
METRYDVIIAGGGPAGLSAAITARQRGMSAAVISNDASGSGLYKAEKICNYPGLPDISGADLLSALVSHAEKMGAVIMRERVSAVLPAGGAVSVNHTSGVSLAGAVILAVGIARDGVFPGELELLGRGVSYCATCDGVFFRGKRVCVVMRTADAETEAAYLESIGCDVVRLTRRGDAIAINGADRVESVTAGGETTACDGVFILRDTVLPAALAAGIELSGGHIKADASMRTNLPGVFAAGDCAGAPYQIAKAAGQGQTAALAASEFLRGP